MRRRRCGWGHWAIVGERDSGTIKVQRFFLVEDFGVVVMDRRYGGINKLGAYLADRPEPRLPPCNSNYTLLARNNDVTFASVRH